MVAPGRGAMALTMTFEMDAVSVFFRCWGYIPSLMDRAFRSSKSITQIEALEYVSVEIMEYSIDQEKTIQRRNYKNV